MTGLNPESDTILSISCFITSHDLNFVEPKGYHAVISTSALVLNGMDEWCTQTHTASGLVAACQAPTAIPVSQASEEVLAYIKQYVPDQRIALLAGNSVHADKMFLVKEPWKPIIDHLHYRILDVSAIKEAARRWCSDSVLERVPVKKNTHTAREDILESLQEARFYMGLFKQMK